MMTYCYLTMKTTDLSALMQVDPDAAKRKIRTALRNNAKSAKMVQDTAQELGVSYSTLYRMIHKHDDLVEFLDQKKGIEP